MSGSCSPLLENSVNTLFLFPLSSRVSLWKLHLFSDLCRGDVWQLMFLHCLSVLDVHTRVWLWFISLTLCSWPELWCSFLSHRPVVWRQSQVQKLLFSCVTCPLLVLRCSLLYFVFPQTQSVSPVPFLLALHPQSDVRKDEQVPPKLFCDDLWLFCQAPPDLWLAVDINDIIFRDCWGLSWCGWQSVCTRFASNTSPGANYCAWEHQRSGTID